MPTNPTATAVTTSTPTGGDHDRDILSTNWCKELLFWTSMARSWAAELSPGLELSGLNLGSSWPIRQKQMDNSSISGNLSGGAVRDQGLTVRRTLAPGTTESRPGFVTLNWPPRGAAKSASQGAEGEKSGLRKLVARVRILDPAFSGRSSYYFLQSGLAALATVLVLPLLLLRGNTFFATSLAATACVAFVCRGLGAHIPDI